jgi:type II secretory pathway pseudopilin PulG
MRPAAPRLPQSRSARSVHSAFTLLEIILAIFIAALIMLAAVPSINGVLEEQRARKLFNQFDDLARQASVRAVTERRPYVLAWDDSGVTMRPQAPNQDEQPAQSDRVEFGDKLAPDLHLPAALSKDPPRIWTFWPTGTCEPATVTCHIADSPWTAAYDPLSEQASFSSP